MISAWSLFVTDQKKYRKIINPNCSGTARFPLHTGTPHSSEIPLPSEPTPPPIAAQELSILRHIRFTDSSHYKNGALLMFKLIRWPFFLVTTMCTQQGNDDSPLLSSLFFVFSLAKAARRMEVLSTTPSSTFVPPEYRFVTPIHYARKRTWSIARLGRHHYRIGPPSAYSTPNVCEPPALFLLRTVAETREAH